MMKRMLSVCLALLLILMPMGALAEKIGVSMPTKHLQRWIQDGENMMGQLQAAGYDVELVYADQDVENQIGQVDALLSNGAKVLIIAAIDSSSLIGVLEKAKALSVPVIAYDRLIRESDAVSYYATFDNYKVGTIQGSFVEAQLGLAAGNGPFNLEFTGGAPEDNNAQFFFQGAYDVLKPYIDNGQLIVQSGQMDFYTVATLSWSTEIAQARMLNILNTFYADKQIDAVVCANDSTALGISNALIEAGYDQFPIVTGQDCDKDNIRNMISGRQSMSIFKDTRLLAGRVVTMVDDILSGNAPEINDITTYDNGVMIVPTYLCQPEFVDPDNYRAVLIDSGYYTEADIAVAE